MLREGGALTPGVGLGRGGFLGELPWGRLGDNGEGLPDAVLPHTRLSLGGPHFGGKNKESGSLVCHAGQGPAGLRDQGVMAAQAAPALWWPQDALQAAATRSWRDLVFDQKPRDSAPHTELSFPHLF